MSHQSAILLPIVAALSLRAAEPVPAVSRITAVTLYADRAQVTRVAEVSVEAGVRIVAFAGLPGWLDEESVRVTLDPESRARIADVQVRRVFLARNADAELRAAELAVREIEDQTVALDDELKAIEAQAQQVAEIKAFSLEKLPRDAVIAAIDVRKYGDTVAFVGDQLRALAAARRELARKRRDLAPELDVRRRKMVEAQQRCQLEQRTVLVTLDAPAADKATLSLVYMLPGATWEAVHELRASGRNPESVAVASFALVTQTTGEDWPDAMLAFSTQSPTEIVRIPELQALLVGSPSAPINAAVASFEKAKTLHAGQNAIWFNVNNPDMNAQQVYGDNWQRQNDAQGRALASFEQLRTRGTSFHFPGMIKVGARGDGTTVRVPIGSVTIAAKPLIVAAPEVSLSAARVLQLTNTGKQPLLPGKIARYHDGAFLGLTDTEFVAENEPFEVMLGVADQIKLTRVLDRKYSSLRRGSRTRMQVAFDVRVENLSNEAASVRLIDRVPVSEDREVRVFDVEIAPAVKADSRGMLRWDLSLKAREKRAFRIAYTVEYPPAVLKMRAKQSLDSESLDLPAPAAADLYIQIESLEKKF